MHRLTGPIGPITIALGLLITIASLVLVRRDERCLEMEAEHAFPGPLDASSPMNPVAQDHGQEASLRLDTKVD